MKISITIRDANTLDQVVDAINRGGACEGMEGVEFSAEELAGQYAAEAARESEFTDPESLAYHLGFLCESGAQFDRAEALDWAVKVMAAFHEVDHQEVQS